MTPYIIPTLNTGNHIMSKYIFYAEFDSWDDSQFILAHDSWAKFWSQLLFHLWAAAWADTGAFQSGGGASNTFEEEPAGPVLPGFSPSWAGECSDQQVNRRLARI